MDDSTLLALVAVILAALAFIAAFLQVLLEYASSTTARNKCDVNAIGPAANQTKWSWSFSDWKLRVEYPRLRMDRSELMAEFMKAERSKIDTNERINSIRKQHNWQWRAAKSVEKVKRDMLADDQAVMITPGKDGRPIRSRDLNWREYLYFQWYRLLHPLRRLHRPRASWAQIITAMGIQNTANMKIDLVDAESVPENLDTPIQRVKLRELGSLAFTLGFHSVELDIPTRTFRALSPIATITTSDNGKILKFEGDIVAIRVLIGRCQTEWVFRASFLVGGGVSFGKYLAMTAFCPLQVISKAIWENLPSGLVIDEQRKAIRAGARGYAAGPICLEAALMRKYLLKPLEKLSKELLGKEKSIMDNPFADPLFESQKPANRYGDDNAQLKLLVMTEQDTKSGFFDGCIARWQAKTGSAMPTLYVAASFLSIHGTMSAFPVRSLLVPFVPWVRRRAKKLLQTFSDCIYVSSGLSQAMTEGTLIFAREESTYLLATGEGGNSSGTFGWGITKMREIYDGIPQSAQRDIIPDENQWHARAVVTPETVKLLKLFEIDNWAKDIMETRRTFLIAFRAPNALWIQILILDVAIQFLIHGHWGFEQMVDLKETEELEHALKRKDHDLLIEKLEIYPPYFREAWGRKEAAVVQAIVRAWRLTGLLENSLEVAIGARDGDQSEDEDSPNWKEQNQDPRDWDLEEALYSDPRVVFGDDPASKSAINRRAMCAQLAGLLELRAIFVIGYLLLHPDSSDIYESEQREEDIEMPMA